VFGQDQVIRYRRVRQHRVRRHPGQPLVALRDVQEPPLRPVRTRGDLVDHPARQVVGQRPQPRLAFAQRSLGLGLRRLVAQRQHRAGLRARGVLQRPRAAVRDDLHAVRPADAPAGAFHHLARDGARQRQFARRVGPPVLGEQVVGLGVGLRLDIEPRDTVHRRRRRVHVGDPPRGVGDDHPLRQLPEDGRLLRGRRGRRRTRRVARLFRPHPLGDVAVHQRQAVAGGVAPHLQPQVALDRQIPVRHFERLALRHRRLGRRPGRHGLDLRPDLQQRPSDDLRLGPTVDPQPLGVDLLDGEVGGQQDEPSAMLSSTARLRSTAATRARSAMTWAVISLTAQNRPLTTPCPSRTGV
jgi:hypothetical protein